MAKGEEIKIRVDDGMKKSVVHTANQRGVSEAQIVREAIAAYLDRVSKLPAPEASATAIAMREGTVIGYGSNSDPADAQEKNHLKTEAAAVAHADSQLGPANKAGGHVAGDSNKTGGAAKRKDAKSHPPKTHPK